MTKEYKVTIFENRTVWKNLKRLIEIDVKNNQPEMTINKAKVELFFEDIINKRKAHNKLYDTSESWPGKRVLKVSLGDLIKSKSK